MFNRGSLMPRLLGPDYWDTFDFPSTIDQDFGDIVDWATDVFEPRTTGLWPSTQARPLRQWSDLERQPWQQQLMQRPFRPLARNQRQLQTLQPQVGVSQVENDAEKFCVGLDCRHFNPDEVSVEFGDNNTVLIQGKHDERSDEHGYVSRSFKRRYVLPRECDLEQVRAQWGDNGQLCITCPKTVRPIEGGTGRKVPIQGAYRGQQSIGQGQQGQLSNAQQKSDQKMDVPPSQTEKKIPEKDQGVGMGQQIRG